MSDVITVYLIFPLYFWSIFQHFLYKCYFITKMKVTLKRRNTHFCYILSFLYNWRNYISLGYLPQWSRDWSSSELPSSWCQEPARSGTESQQSQLHKCALQGGRRLLLSLGHTVTSSASCLSLVQFWKLNRKVALHYFFSHLCGWSSDPYQLFQTS